MRTIGQTSRWKEGQKRNKHVQIGYSNYREGVYLKRFDGIRHPEEPGKRFLIPKEQLSEVINYLIRAERELQKQGQLPVMEEISPLMVIREVRQDWMLVLIDLQESYLEDFLHNRGRWGKFLKNLRERVRQAKESKETIVNVTSERDGLTVPCIYRMFKNYPLRYGIDKLDFDGSLELQSLISEKNIQTKNIELCGAFRDVCVLETWKGLKKKGLPVLPIEKSLTLPTTDNWRGINAYPKGYFR